MRLPRGRRRGAPAETGRITGRKQGLGVEVDAVCPVCQIASTPCPARCFGVVFGAAKHHVVVGVTRFERPPGGQNSVEAASAEGVQKLFRLPLFDLSAGRAWTPGGQNSVEAASAEGGQKFF